MSTEHRFGGVSDIPGIGTSTESSNDWVLDSQIDKLVRHKARTLAQSPGFTRSDQADLAQRLRLHLLQKATKYNSARGNRTSWANRVIENKAISMARKTDAKKRSYRRNTISLNEVIADG